LAKIGASLALVLVFMLTRPPENVISVLKSWKTVYNAIVMQNAINAWTIASWMTKANVNFVLPYFLTASTVSLQITVLLAKATTTLIKQESAKFVENLFLIVSPVQLSLSAKLVSRTISSIAIKDALNVLSKYLSALTVILAQYVSSVA